MPRAKGTITLDHAGVAAVLNGGDVTALLVGHAKSIASGVAAPGAIGRVVVDPTQKIRLAGDAYTRPRTSVTIKDMRGMAWEGKYGALSQPARNSGLDFKGKR